jgi:hypothetical protein
LVYRDVVLILMAANDGQYHDSPFSQKKKGETKLGAKLAQRLP